MDRTASARTGPNWDKSDRDQHSDRLGVWSGRRSRWPGKTAGLPGLNFNVEEWDAKRADQRYALALARAVMCGVRRCRAAMTSPYRGHHRCKQYCYGVLGNTSQPARGRHALSCLPYYVFDADLGERRSNGRSSSVQTSSVLCESQRRLLSVYG